MKLITRDTDYAIRALCCIAKFEKTVVSADELVKCLKIPRPFLRKILQKLNKRGVVRSYKGKGGGFSLSIAPNKLSLFSIIRVLQGPIKLNDHTFKKKVCPYIGTCNIKKKIDCIERTVISQLKTLTIASIIKGEKRWKRWQKGR